MEGFFAKIVKNWGSTNGGELKD